MIVAARIGREMAIQMLGFGVQIADRILIAGILIRVWGVSGFAEWSLALAAGGLVSLFDFGVNLYWANRVLFLVQQGQVERARAVVRGGNLLMIAASAIGLFAVILGFGLYGGQADGVTVTPELWLAAALVALATFARTATTIQMSVYRAHELYARQSVLMAAADVGRLLVTIAVVAAGGSVLSAAVAQAAAAVTIHAYIMAIDSKRNFPDYPFGIGSVPADERPGAVHLSLGFWIQSAPATALTYLPIFLIGGVGTAAGIAQFVLMRTLSNVMRAVLQPFSVVLGQESSRRFAIDDRDGVASTYAESLVLLGVLGAIPAAALMALGEPFFALWSGQGGLFDPTMLMLAIAPPLLLPSLALAQAYLATINDPWPIAWSRVAQVLLSVLGYIAMPIPDPGLRMFAALALGEVVGLGIGLTGRVIRTVPGSGTRLHLRSLGTTVLTFGLTYGAARAGVHVADAPVWQLLAGATLAGFVGTIALLAFGIDRRRQRGLVEIVRARLRP